MTSWPRDKTKNKTELRDGPWIGLIQNYDEYVEGSSGKVRMNSRKRKVQDRRTQLRGIPRMMVKADLRMSAVFLGEL